MESPGGERSSTELPTDSEPTVDEQAKSAIESPVKPIEQASAKEAPRISAAVSAGRPNASSMFKTKILILGPVKAGKTTIANYLADAAENIASEYRPTHGARIVEFESNDLSLDGHNIDAEVELWDCSGDRRFEKCWPALQRNVHGVILVYDGENEQQVAELETWYNTFVLRRGIRNNRVLIFAHTIPRIDNASAKCLPPPAALQDVQCVYTNIESAGEQLRLAFNNFLCSVIGALATHAT